MEGVHKECVIVCPGEGCKRGHLQQQHQQQVISYACFAISIRRFAGQRVLYVHTLTTFCQAHDDVITVFMYKSIWSFYAHPPYCDKPFASLD